MGNRDFRKVYPRASMICREICREIFNQKIAIFVKNVEKVLGGQNNVFMENRDFREVFPKESMICRKICREIPRTMLLKLLLKFP